MCAITSRAQLRLHTISIIHYWVNLNLNSHKETKVNLSMRFWLHIHVATSLCHLISTALINSQSDVTIILMDYKPMPSTCNVVGGADIHDGVKVWESKCLLALHRLTDRHRVYYSLLFYPVCFHPTIHLSSYFPWKGVWISAAYSYCWSITNRWLLDGTAYPVLQCGSQRIHQT